MERNEKSIKFIMIFIILVSVLGILYLLLRNRITPNKEIVFNIKSNAMEVKVGGEVPIDYEVSDNLNVIWESMDPQVATVNNLGIVTGVSFGNAMIKGTVISDEVNLTRICSVSTYLGEKNHYLNEIVVPEGELFITKGTTYKVPINYNPFDAYINSIDYHVENSNIVDFDGTILAKNVGKTIVTITINQTISKTIIVNVISKAIEPTFSKKMESVSINSDDLALKPQDTKKLEYTVSPEGAFIENVHWESSNSSIVNIDDNGWLTAKASGNATIKLVINNQYVDEINVSIGINTTGIKLKSKPKLVLKVGKKETIKVEILPANATNKKVKYKSTNSSVLKVDNNGIATALSAGNGSVSITTEDGNYSVSVPFTIIPQKGIINGDGGIWGYTSSLVKTPVRADAGFFQKLASSGKGTFSNNVYTYSNGKYSYKYEISNSILRVNNQAIFMRFYYPTGVDLSTVNTFTFFGGGSERSFGGYFNALNQNPSAMKSSGIIILISARSSYGSSDGMYATDFVKSIVGQKNGVKNAVGGYSMSGPAAAQAANNGSYDRLIIFDSYFDNVASNNNLKNKEIIIYSPVGDDMLKHTLPTLNQMTNSNYRDVIIISNNSQITNKYSAYYPVINPGTKMGSGHGYVNITNANVFAYACS